MLIGGAATLSGPVLGAAGLYYFLDYVEKSLGEYRFVLFGFILIVAIIYFPRGVVGGLNRLWDWAKGRRARYKAREVTP